VLNGRLRHLHVVGIGISPEFVFQLQPGVVSPNDARYGVAWMPRLPLEAAFDQHGAFNDVVARLAPEASRGAVIAALDRRLAPYGGRGAYGRDEQSSARFLDSKIEQIRGMLVILPTLFLLVAAFVLNVVLGRLVQSQREQIGTLKAFGYSNGRLARHYLLLATLALLPGALLGAVGGLSLGGALVRLYVKYFRLPVVDDIVNWPAIGGAFAVVFAAATVGALQAVRAVARLKPVEAMRPPAPPVYRHGLVERLRLARRVPAALLMVVRNLRLAPLRAGASIVALAFATALCLVGNFFGDAVDALVRHQFERAMREDLMVSFVRPIDVAACQTLRSLDGVVACEPLLGVPARAVVGPRAQRVNVTAFAEGSQLRRVIATDGNVVPVPPEGLLVSRRLLGHLDAGVGDAIALENLEGRPIHLTVPVRAAVDDELGLNIWAAPATLTRLLGETPPMSGALLRVAPAAEESVVRRLSGMPTVVGVIKRASALADFEETQAKSMRAMVVIMALLSAVLAVAVVYNGARVALAERARDLASLRVLGFTRAEVSRILFGEMTVQLGLGVPLGIWLGRALGRLIVVGAARDEIRVPFVITPWTHLLAVLVVVGASLLSALHLRRLIDRLDLVEVLKTRE
jgi:putative ABC transport system permease protein